MIKVSWPAFIFASAVMIAMLWPYLMSFFSPSKPVVSIKEDTFLGRGLIYGYPLIKGIFYWFRYASTYFSSDIFTGTTYTWLPSWLGFFMKITLAGLKWVLAIATLVVAFRANFELAKTFKESCRRQGEMSPRDWLRTYTCWTFVAVLVAVAASPVTISYWHLLIIFPQSILPLLFFWDGHQRLFQTVTQSKTILIGFIIVVSLISFFGAMSSVRHDYKVGVHTEFILLDLEGRFEPAATKPPQ